MLTSSRVIAVSSNVTITGFRWTAKTSGGAYPETSDATFQSGKDYGVSFDVKGPVYLEPGGSYTLPLRGTAPAKSLTTADITVNYSLIGSATPLGSRTLTFAVMNGDPPAYNAAAPYTAALHETDFDKNVPQGMDTLLKRTGVYDFLKMIVNALRTVLRTVLRK